MRTLRMLAGSAIALTISACGASPPPAASGWQFRQVADQPAGSVSEQAFIDLPVANGHAHLTAHCLPQNHVAGSDRDVEVQITFLTDNSGELRVGPTRMTGGVKTVRLRASVAAGQVTDIVGIVDHVNAVKFNVDASLFATRNGPSALRVETPLLFHANAQNAAPIARMEVIDLQPQDANLRALFNLCNPS